jgi:hypothetical protein
MPGHKLKKKEIAPDQLGLVFRPNRAFQLGEGDLFLTAERQLYKNWIELIESFLAPSSHA